MKKEKKFQNKEDMRTNPEAEMVMQFRDKIIEIIKPYTNTESIAL